MNEPLPEGAETASKPVSDAVGDAQTLSKEPRANDWMTVLQFILSLVAILGLWGIALLFALAGMVGQGLSESQQVLIQTFGLFASGALVLPSLITSFYRLRGRPLPLAYAPLLKPAPWVWLVVLSLVLGFGYLMTSVWTAGVLVPVFNVLAVVLPALFLISVSTRGLPVGSPQRRTGVLAAGLTLGPLIILIAEFAVLIAIFVIVAVSISNQPDLMNSLSGLSEEITTGRGDPEAILGLLTPYLANPAVILGVLSFFAVLGPLIEELFKPIGVWLLAGRKLTPAAGFTAGAISGAGFAIFESILLNPGGEGWMAVAMARVGPAVMHIVTTALSGWAIASSWRDGKYVRLVITLLAVVGLHGLWNGLTVMAALQELAMSNGVEIQLPLINPLGTIAPYALVVIAIGAFITLLWVNRILRRSHPQQEPTKVDVVA